MPKTTPQVGEFWTTKSVVSGRDLVFQVERIDGNVVTLLYPDGRRLRAPRSNMPNSFWSYQGPAPGWRVCYVPSCTDCGKFALGEDSARRYACEKHLPVERVPERPRRSTTPTPAPASAATPAPAPRQRGRGARNETTTFAPALRVQENRPNTPTAEVLEQVLIRPVPETPTTNGPAATRYDMLEKTDV